MEIGKLNRTQLIAGGAVFVALAGGLLFWWLGGEPVQIAGGSCKPITTVAVTADDFTMGEAKAPITLVEYAS